MARLSTCGFENNSTLGSKEQCISFSGTTSISSSIKRSGNYALRINPSSSYGNTGSFVQTELSDSLFYLRFYIYVASAPTSDAYIFYTNDGMFDNVGIQMNSSGALELWNIEDTAQVGSDSDALDTDTWYRIEIKMDVTSGSSSTSLDAKIDGVTFASGVIDLGSTTNYFQNFGCNNASTETYDIYFDDIAINDNLGSYQNSWPGEGKVVYLRPNGDGEASSWTASTGADWECVNEETPNGTDYIYSTTLNNESIFTLTSPPAEMASDATINVVEAHCVCRSDGGETTGFKFELEKESGGTKTLGSEVTSGSASFRLNDYFNTDPARASTLVSYQDPDSNDWTKATLDTARLGVKTTLDGTDVIDIDTIWLQVEYTGDGATKIDDASNFGDMPGPGRQVVRDSNGYLWSAQYDGTNDDIELWRSTDGGSNWTEQDSGDSPSPTNIDNSIDLHTALAIDSSDVLNVTYAYFDTSYGMRVDHVTFSSGNWGTPSNIITSTASSGGYTDFVASIDIAMDSNNVPHVVVAYHEEYFDLGLTYFSDVDYINKTGGSWQSKVNIEGYNSGSSSEEFYSAVITINAEDIPEIAYVDTQNTGLNACLGNQNNATTFSAHVVDSSAYTITPNITCSIGIGSGGLTWIAYANDGLGPDLFLAKHTGTTWTTNWTTYAADTGLFIFKLSIFVNGTNIYCFYTADGGTNNDDIVYNMYNGSSWSGETVLETGTFQDVKTLWASATQHDSNGDIVNSLRTYYFDGSDVAATQDGSGWSNVTNSDDGDTGTYANTSTTGSKSANYIEIQGTNAPATGGTIVQVKMRKYGYSWSDYVTLSTPTGGWTWAKIQALETRSWVTLSSIYTEVYIDGDAGGTSLGQAMISETGWLARIEIIVQTSDSPSEIDYLFSDGA